MKKLTTVLVSASVLSLVGCGAPVGIFPLSVESIVMADAGHIGARSATIDLTHAFEAQAKVHRWVKEDVVNYHVTLAEVAPGSQAIVAGDEAFKAQDFADAMEGGLSVVLTSSSSKAKFTGLSAGKKYAAFIVVEGREKGSSDPLRILNQQQGYQVQGQFIDFTGENDFNDSQSIAATPKLDDVAFSGTGRVSIDQVTDGTYLQPTGPVTGTPEN